MLDKAFKLFQRKKTHRKKEREGNVLYSIEFIKLEQKKENKKTKTKSTIQNYYSVSKLKLLSRDENIFTANKKKIHDLFLDLKDIPEKKKMKKRRYFIWPVT